MENKNLSQNGTDSIMANGRKNGNCSALSQTEYLKNLAEFSAEKFNEFLDSIDAVLFDCDGVIWLGNHPLHNSQSLVKILRAKGKQVFFITNNSTKTRKEFLVKLNTLGFEASIGDIVSTSYLAALFLKEMNFTKKVYVVGSPGVIGELDEAGISSLPIGPDLSLAHVDNWTNVDYKKVELDDEVGAVIVGFDFHFNYAKLFKAASYLRDPNCIFIATNTDESFPAMGNMVIPGTGAIVSAVQTAAGRPPHVMGKPSTAPFDFVKRSYNLDPKRTLMVGDRGNTDIVFGRNCNMWTLLVLTGVTTLSEAKAWSKTGTEEEKRGIPHMFLYSVGDFFNLIKKNDASL